MKKLISILLTLIIMCSFNTLSLASDAYSLEILAEGRESVKTSLGEEINISLRLFKGDKDRISLYSIQDYICFDTEYLEMVAGSLKVYAPDGINPLGNASAVKFSPFLIESENRVYFNRSSLESVAIPSGTDLVTFRLRAKKEGSTDITHDTVEMFRNAGEKDRVFLSEARVIIEGAYSEEYPVSIVSDIEGGRISSNKAVAKEGEEIRLRVSPDSGNEIRRVSVSTPRGEVVSVKELSEGVYTFIMPDGEVEVNAVFSRKTAAGGGGGGGATVKTFPIDISSDIKNGEIRAVEEAAFLASVMVRVMPDEGYEIESLRVTDEYGRSIYVKDNGNGIYSFEIPASAVTIKGGFKEINASITVEEPIKALEHSGVECKRDKDCPLYLFEDLDINGWYHDGVHFVLEKGYMSGFPHGIFQPEGSVTRAQLVSVLFRIDGKPNAPFAGFEDVFYDEWYSNAVDWASYEGIVQGTGENRFSPSEPVTREQMAAILYRYANYKGYDTSERADLSRYTDKELVSEYAYIPLEWANAHGIISSMTDTTIGAKGNATRAQIASILYRFCQNMGKQ